MTIQREREREREGERGRDLFSRCAWILYKSVCYSSRWGSFESSIKSSTIELSYFCQDSKSYCK